VLIEVFNGIGVSHATTEAPRRLGFLVADLLQFLRVFCEKSRPERSKLRLMRQRSLVER
jgi:hypothetical protein